MVPKSGPGFWKTGPERDLGPDAPVFSPNGDMATQNTSKIQFLNEFEIAKALILGTRGTMRQHITIRIAF